jgi:hypothetical protein
MKSYDEEYYIQDGGGDYRRDLTSIVVVVTTGFDLQGMRMRYCRSGQKRKKAMDIIKRSFLVQRLWKQDDMC